jgi:hypothetical protein
MQQSIQASYRLETSQGIPLTSDPTTAIKLNDAKNEAKTRQLMNKVILHIRYSAGNEQKYWEVLPYGVFVCIWVCVC